MDAEETVVLNTEARRKLWRAYQIILDCARHAERETADHGDDCPESSPAADTKRRVRNRRLILEKAHE